MVFYHIYFVSLSHSQRVGHKYTAFSHIHQTFFRFYILNPLFCHSDTHGFDAGGAQTDAIGNTVEEGIWASPDDAQKFEELTQLLVNCYSAFEVMPDELPNLHNDGAFTLNENIADLGGFEIAYTAFVKYLEGKGVWLGCTATAQTLSAQTSGIPACHRQRKTEHRYAQGEP